MTCQTLFFIVSFFIFNYYYYCTCVEDTGNCPCTCLTINLTFCLQVKSQLEWSLGRYWVKLSTCRSALLMSEWPHAPERLYMFSAQRQETTQISTACPTNVHNCGMCTLLGQNEDLLKIYFTYLINSGNIFFFQHKTHQVITTMTSHLGPLTSAEFCPWNEDILVTISEDRTFKVCCSDWQILPHILLIHSQQHALENS